MNITIGQPEQLIYVLPKFFSNTNATLSLPTTLTCEDIVDHARTTLCWSGAADTGGMYNERKDSSYVKSQQTVFGQGVEDPSLNAFMEAGSTKFSWSAGGSQTFSDTPVTVDLFTANSLGMGSIALNTFLAGKNALNMPNQPTVDVISIFTGNSKSAGYVVMGGYDDNMIDHQNMGVFSTSQQDSFSLTLQGVTFVPNGGSGTGTAGHKHRRSISHVHHGHVQRQAKSSDAATSSSSSGSAGSSPSTPSILDFQQTPLNIDYDATDIRLPAPILDQVLKLLNNPTYNSDVNGYTATNPGALLNSALAFTFMNGSSPDSVINVTMPLSSLWVTDPDVDNPLTARVENGTSYFALSPLGKTDTTGHLGRPFVKHIYMTNDLKGGKFHLSGTSGASGSPGSQKLIAGVPIILAATQKPVGGKPTNTKGLPSSTSSSSPSDTSDPNSADAEAHQKSLKQGKIIGIILGITFGLMILVYLLVLWINKRKHTDANGDHRQSLLDPYSQSTKIIGGSAITISRPQMIYTGGPDRGPRRGSAMWLKRLTSYKLDVDFEKESFPNNESAKSIYKMDLQDDPHGYGWTLPSTSTLVNTQGSAGFAPTARSSFGYPLTSLARHSDAPSSAPSDSIATGVAIPSYYNPKDAPNMPSKEDFDANLARMQNHFSFSTDSSNGEYEDVEQVPRSTLSTPTAHRSFADFRFPFPPNYTSDMANGPPVVAQSPIAGPERGTPDPNLPYDKERMSAFLAINSAVSSVIGPPGGKARMVSYSTTRDSHRQSQFSTGAQEMPWDGTGPQEAARRSMIASLGSNHSSEFFGEIPEESKGSPPHERRDSDTIADWKNGHPAWLATAHDSGEVARTAQTGRVMTPRRVSVESRPSTSGTGGTRRSAGDSPERSRSLKRRSQSGSPRRRSLRIHTERRPISSVYTNYTDHSSVYNPELQPPLPGRWSQLLKEKEALNEVPGLPKEPIHRQNPSDLTALPEPPLSAMGERFPGASSSASQGRNLHSALSHTTNNSYASSRPKQSFDGPGRVPASPATSAFNLRPTMGTPYEVNETLPSPTFVTPGSPPTARDSNYASFLESPTNEGGFTSFLSKGRHARGKGKRRMSFRPKR
jgi:hypothetical protein